MRYLRTEKLRSFHLWPIIVVTIAKRAHYKAEKETTCSGKVSVSVSVRVRVRNRVFFGDQGGANGLTRTLPLALTFPNPFAQADVCRPDP